MERRTWPGGLCQSDHIASEPPVIQAGNQPGVPGTAAIVLAGGRNSRMGGRDKAFLRVDGETVIERTVRVLSRCCEELVIVTNDPKRYVSLTVRVVQDELKGLGPLGGLHAGLGAIRSDYAFVTACDMPFLRREPIEYLLAHVREKGSSSEAVVPCWAGDIEPLHAIFARVLQPRISEAVEEGARSLRDFLPRVEADFVPQHVMEEIPGSEESFRNINTPREAALHGVELTDWDER